MHSVMIITIGLIFSTIQPIGSASTTTTTSPSTPVPTTTTSTTPQPTTASSTTTQSTRTSPATTVSTSSATRPTSASTSTMPLTTSSYATTNYSNSLTYSSPTFVRPNSTAGTNYYYQAIQVTIYNTATYTFRSNSLTQLDLYGCFYQYSFDPYNPTRNLVICDDDSAGGLQFLISRYLQVGGTYILVVTTFRNGDTGFYSVTAAGPSTVSMTSITPPATTPAATTTTAPTPSYSGTLSSNSPIFSRPYGSSSSFYYYQALQVMVYTSGTYTLRSTSPTSLDTYGCLYSGSFDPANPYLNLINYDDDGGGSYQFLMNNYLQSGNIYVLVVTTSASLAIGRYSILATGPGYVYMTAITPTPSPTIAFSGSLTYNSPTFSRPHGSSYSTYYYQAIRTITYAAGSYTLRSTSSSGMDTYGCLYTSSFDPTYPNRNLLTCDDDSGGSSQFSISYYLSYGQTYILIVTTYGSRATGSYSILATGPGSVSMVGISTPGSHPMTVGEIIGIIFGCFIFLAIVSIICGCRNRRRVAPQRVITLPTSTNAYPQNVYSPGAQVYAGRPAYAVPPTTREENPPTYQAYMANTKPQQT